MFESKWYPGDHEASTLPKAVNQWVCLIMTLLSGWIIDRYGGRIPGGIFASACLIGAYALLLWTSISPFVAMVLMGIGSGTYRSCSYSYIPYLVTKKQLAPAFGVLTCGMNAAYVVIPLVISQVSKLASSPNDFGPVLIFSMGTASMSLVSFVLLSFENHRVEKRIKETTSEDTLSPEAPLSDDVSLGLKGVSLETHKNDQRPRQASNVSPSLGDQARHRHSQFPAEEI